MSTLFTNNAVGYVKTGINAIATSVTLKTGQGALFPVIASPDIAYATFEDEDGNREIVKITNRTGDVFTITRGQESTTGQTWAEDDVFELRLTAGLIQDMTDGLDTTDDIVAILEVICDEEVGVDDAGDFAVMLLGDHPVVTGGFNDGTQEISFPTNNMGACKFMTGEATTIIWMYLNTAPKGWKALSTGADMVLGIAGGAASFNVNGGNPGSTNTWTISGLTKDAHTHITTILVAGWGTIGSLQGMGTLGGNLGYGTAVYGPTANRNFTSGAQSDAGVTSSGAWRPKASVGKLFQLDTA